MDGIFRSLYEGDARTGIPRGQCDYTKAPFDILGDTLRGTRGIMVDMYRQPEKLIQAMDAMLPFWIKKGVDSAKGMGNPFIFLPLHKGADGFLSDKQYKKFYWPYLKKILLGLIDEGVVPFCGLRGANSRLEVIRDLPKGKTAGCSTSRYG